MLRTISLSALVMMVSVVSIPGAARAEDKPKCSAHEAEKVLTVKLIVQTDKSKKNVEIPYKLSLDAGAGGSITALRVCGQFAYGKDGQGETHSLTAIKGGASFNNAAKFRELLKIRGDIDAKTGGPAVLEFTNSSFQQETRDIVLTKANGKWLVTVKEKPTTGVDLRVEMANDKPYFSHVDFN